jgi:hypothetical protein
MEKDMLVGIFPSNRKNKKWTARFGSHPPIHFGAAGYEDYTIHKDETKKKNWIARHSKLKGWDLDNPFSASSLAYYILWNKKTLDASIADYKRQFNL